MIQNLKSWKTTILGVIAILIIGIFAIGRENVTLEMLIAAIQGIVLIFLARDPQPKQKVDWSELETPKGRIE